MAEVDRLPPRLPQVFVSFCKEELGGNFVTHLVWAMRESGINVLIDSYSRRDSIKRFSIEPMIVQSWEEALNFVIKRSTTGLSLERQRNEFALVAAIVKEVARLLPNSPRMRRRRKLGIGEVFFRALTATFLFALFISPMLTHDVNFLKIGNLLVGFPFLVVVLHKILC
ncbi:TIR domain-containing protein [Raphanus sativus]|nr:TIR domain-containing protein [Raphanus sativus]